MSPISLALWIALNAWQVSPPPPAIQRLCSATFDHDRKKPSRVDNEAKACLDDIALQLQRSPDAWLVLVGNSAADNNLAAQRAVNMKAYLVTEKAIEASRIVVLTGSKNTEEVEDFLAPLKPDPEKDFPNTKPVDEAKVRPQSRFGPRPVHRSTNSPNS